MNNKKIIIMIILNISFWIDGHASWEYVTPMPHARYNHDAVLGNDGKIYVMGGMVMREKGRGKQHQYNTSEYSTLKYDPAEKVWNYMEEVPGSLLGGWFYVKERGKWEYKKMKFTFDWKTHQLNDILPNEYKKFEDKVRYTDFTRLGWGVATVASEKGFIWWIGGGNLTKCGEDIVLIYIISENRWFKVNYHTEQNKFILDYEIPVSTMQERREGHKAVITKDGKIFVMGGVLMLDRPRESTQPKFYVSNTVECYDPKGKKWVYKKPMRVKRVNFAAVLTHDGNIYVFGGSAGNPIEKGTPVLDTVEVYDPRTDEWSTRRPMPVRNTTHAAVLGSDNRIYILGGLKGTSGRSPEDGVPVNDVYIYDPAKDEWKKGPSMHVRRSGLAAVSTPDGKIYAIGGTDVGAYTGRQNLNVLLPEMLELYAGRVQNTVEVLDINK